MAYQDIRTEDDGHVRRIITSRPQYRNAQSRRLLEELDHAFAAAADDAGVRVVVLLGDGDHFSGGHDLGTPEEWMVASAMDIIYAPDDAMFLGGNFQYFSIPWDMSPRLAKELLYESRFIRQ